MKKYIKKVACYPKEVTHEIYQKANTIFVMGSGNVSRSGSVKMTETVDLTVRDKVFINLMVCEAKR